VTENSIHIKNLVDWISISRQNVIFLDACILKTTGGLRILHPPSRAWWLTARQ